MRKAITMDRVKNLTRGLLKEVDERQMRLIERQYVYFNGEFMFRWYGKDEEEMELGMKNLRISKSMAYNKVGEGLYRRKYFIALDRELYNLINTNGVARRMLAVEDLRTDKCKKINGGLRYLNVYVDTVGLETGLVVMSESVKTLERSKVKENFKGLDGYGLEQEFIGWLAPEFKKAIGSNSDKNKMVVWLLEKDYHLWGDFLRITKEYDNYIHKR